MPKLEIDITHKLTQSEALNRIQHFLPQLKSQYSDKIKDLEESWSGSKGQFRFKIYGAQMHSSLIIIPVT